MEKKGNRRQVKTEEERKQEHKDFIERLKSLPPEKLSKMARWILESEGRPPFITYVDMKAAMK